MFIKEGNKLFRSITVEKYLNRKANYHTHTPRCQHAEGTEREYIEAAIANGYEVLGFSDHGPHIYEDGYVSDVRMTMEQFEDYAEKVTALKKEYAGTIEILLGLETEYFPKTFAKEMDILSGYPLDYMLLGQHFYDAEQTNPYAGRATADKELIRTYVATSLEALDTGCFMYMAHPDIPEYIGDRKFFDKTMEPLYEALAAHQMPLEINVNGCRIMRNYPSRYLIDAGLRTGNRFIVGVDAHSPKELFDRETYRACVALAADRGGKLINVNTGLLKDTRDRL